ncbi:MAG: response regulator [Pseudomonadota bacterium]
MANIMIVDDDAQVRSILSQILEAGHTVKSAAGGKGALAALGAGPPDLVVTDILMPEIGGIDTIAGLRSRFPGLKTMAISGGSEFLDPDELTRFAGDVGADPAFVKPVKKGELLDAIDEFLKSRG